MKTDQKILELVSDCKKALDNESFAYAKHVVFGMAPLLIEAVEQLFVQRKDAYAQTDKIHGENLGLHITLTQIRDAIGATKDWNNAEWSTLPGLVKKALEKSVPEYAKLAHANHALNERNEQQLKEIVLSRNAIADLKAQLSVSERMSNDRNEARVTGLSEITALRNDLANTRQVADDRGNRLVAAYADRGSVERELVIAKKDRDENISANRKREIAWNEATGVGGPRLAGEKIAEIVNERDALRINLIAERRAAKELHDRHQVTVADFNTACDERDSLRMKLETQTKIAVACQDAVGRATREQVERMKAIREGKLVDWIAQVLHTGQQTRSRARYGEGWKPTAAAQLSDCSAEFREGYMQDAANVLADLAQTPVELPSAEHIARVFIGAADNEQITAQRIRDGADVRGMIMARIAPLLAARNATKVELPSIEEMHEQFDKGFEEAISETRGSTAHAADANGLRRVRDLIAARLGLTEQKPTKTETVASVEVSEPAPTRWDRFKKATGRTRQITERPLYFSDLKALCELLDR